MNRIRWFTLLLAVPLLAGLVALSGCGGGSKDKTEGKGAGSGPSGTEEPVKAGALEELKSAGVATIKGKVTYDGDPPPKVSLKEKMVDQVKEKKDLDHCLKEDTDDPTWIVGPDKGVQNVVVWIRPPKGKYFKIPEDQRKRTDAVTMDQPFCEFKPHVVVTYPSYYDPDSKMQKKTGQTFKVLNSAPLNHNTAYKGTNALLNPGKNEILPGKKEGKTSELVVAIKPCEDKEAGKEATVNFNCDIHKWMTAIAMAFDHPWAAVTDEKGNFEIKGVPAECEIYVTAWHEQGANKGWALPNGAGKREGESLKLKGGDVKELNFKVKKE